MRVGSYKALGESLASNNRVPAQVFNSALDLQDFKFDNA